MKQRRTGALHRHALRVTLGSYGRADALAEQTHHRAGLLLINTGTPDSPDVLAVRRYLREFLLDPRVLDIGAWRRRLLVDLIIVPRRVARTAAAYRRVWTAQGSPLLVHGRALATKLSERLATKSSPIVDVALGMRYGRPSIDEALDRLQQGGCSSIVLLPLYPQHAAASAGSAIAAAYQTAAARLSAPLLRVIPPFFDHPAYVGALAAHVRHYLEGVPYERLIVSFHGLPLRQLQKGGAKGCLQRPDCCARLTRDNRGCYRAQCAATARLLGQALGLPREQIVLCFQSRMGSGAWIEPYTQEVLDELPRQGVRRAALVSPSFVADCLETLEELGRRAVQQFARSGGEMLQVVPSLNAEEGWVAALEQIAQEALPAD